MNSGLPATPTGSLPRPLLRIITVPEGFDGRPCPDCAGAGWHWAGITTTLREACRTCQASGYVRVAPVVMEPHDG